MLGQISHIELYVSDLKKTLEFWRWFLSRLGYKKHQEFSQGESWILETTYVVFVQTEAKYLEPTFHRKRTGLNHIAFYADSKEEIDEIAKEVERRGLNILYRDKHPYAGGNDHYALYFEDPDRIKVECVLKHENRS